MKNFKNTILKKIPIIFTSLIIIVLLFFCFFEGCNFKRYVEEQKVEFEKYELTQHTENIGGNEDIYDKLADTYLDYYESIEQQADDAINKLMAFIGILATIITIYNIFLAFRLPAEFEKKLSELDKKINQTEIYATSAKVSASMVNALNAETTIEKIKDMSDLIDKYPDDSELYFIRGSLYDEIKKFDEAEADYKKAKFCGGSEIRYHNSMAVLYNQMMNTDVKLRDVKKVNKSFEIAKKHYEKAIKLAEKEKNYNSSHIYCNLACLYQEHKEYDEALKLFAIAIEKDGSNATAYANRAISKEEIAMKNNDISLYKSAYDDYIKSKEIDPENKKNIQDKFDLAATLFEKTREIYYANEASEDYKILFSEIEKNEKLRRKMLRMQKALCISPELDDENAVEQMLAKIDEKIGDLTLEEANEIESAEEKQAKINEAKASYEEAKKSYQTLYSKDPSEENKKNLERIEQKIIDLNK